MRQLRPEHTGFFVRTLLAALIITLLFSIPATAQLTSGNLAGTVVDQSGAAIPNVTVSAVHTSTGQKFIAHTSSLGAYTIVNLPVGSYDLLIEAQGFTSEAIKGVAVALNITTSKNVTLQVGQLATQVEVAAAGVTIDTQTAQVQTSFQTTELTELPSASSGLGVLNLALLTAGVATSGGVGAGTGPTVGGQRPRNNNFTVEGIDNNSGSVTGPLVGVPNDAVAEFTALQNQFSPDFGHSSGGQFNQIVKSGTNEFHGSAYEYLNNRDLNAADNLNFIDQNPLHSRYDNNRFGGTLGGPIKRNKMFFFIDYEYNPVGGTGSAGLVYAPTANGYSTIATIPGINQTNLSIMKQYLGTATSPLPASLFPMVGPGNESLGEQVASTAKAVEIGQISVTAPSYSNQSNAVAAFDYNISDKDSIRGRYISNRYGGLDTSASLPVFYSTIPSNEYLATFSEYHTFTPSLTNEFRAGFNRSNQTYPVGNFKFPGLDVFPNITLYEMGGVNIGPDPNAPQGGIQNTYQLTDNVTWVKGNHNFKFGFDGWKQISPQFFTQRSRGDYEYSYLSDYLEDYNPDYIAQRSLGGAEYYGDRILSGFYGNDSWKIKRNLTVNIGARYEYNTVPYSERLQTRNAISDVPGLITFGKPQPQKDAIMPRVGLAYSPGTDGKTSIRAGFGINYDVLYDNQGLLTLPPQATTTVDVTGLDQGGFLAGGGIPPNATSATLTQAQARAGTGGYVPNQTRPETVQWNVGIQREFRNNYTFESRYLGTHSVHLSVQDQLNRQPVVNSSNALPLYYTAPSQATLDGLTNTLSNLTALYNAHGNVIPAYLQAGFTGIITSYQPWGNSIYHGLANQLTRRFSNGLQFVTAYTWSHAMDDSTADVFSTYLTPRRPQDARNIRGDWSSSALDHRQRFTDTVIYDMPFFKNSRWLVKNIVGNWEFAPIYTYQTGTLYDVQSGVDANLNGDSAGDRVFVNKSGEPNVGSGTTALKNSAGQTVAFLVNNPNAGYVAAPKGTLPNGGRNTEHLNPIDDLDMTVAKNIWLTEKYKLQFAAQFFNIFNHPQYIGSNINSVASVGYTSGAVHNFLIPTNSLFADPTQAFSSNPRSIQISAKFTF